MAKYYRLEIRVDVPKKNGEPGKLEQEVILTASDGNIAIVKGPEKGKAGLHEIDVDQLRKVMDSYRPSYKKK